MTEQELRDKLISVAPSAVYANESEIQAIVDLAKAYAEARQSKEIAELKAQVEGLKTDMQHSRLIEAAQVKESNELKAESKYWKDRWESQNKANDAEFSSIIAQNAENKRLKDEVERLREGIQDAVDWLNNPDDNVDFDELLQSLLSPAPVTETQNEDQS